MAWRAALIVTMALASIGAAGAQSAAPPVVAAGSVRAAPHPYDESADARRAVNDAIVASRAAGRPVLIDFGANWCPDCRVLAGILALDPVRRWVDAHYTVVEVDVGRFNKNLDLARDYGVKLHAIPTVVVVAPDGRILNADQVEALGDAGSMSPQAVVDLLVRWAPPARSAAP